MHKDTETEKLLIWASDIADNTLEQARRVSTMPFVWPHLALMPDAHLGKGATVGSVIPTLGAVIPSAGRGRRLRHASCPHPVQGGRPAG